MLTRPFAKFALHKLLSIKIVVAKDMTNMLKILYAKAVSFYDFYCIVGLY